MFCMNCGAKLASDDSKFCLNCGAPVKSIALKAFDDNAAEMRTPESVNAAGTEKPSENAESAAAAPSAVLVDEKTEAAASEKNNAVSLSAAAVREKRSVVPVVLFSVLAFVFALYALTAFNLRFVLSENLLSDAVSHCNPSNVKIGELAKQDFIVEMAKSNPDVLSEEMTLAEMVSELSFVAGLEPDEIELMLEETDIMDFVGNVIASYEKYLLEGEADDTVSDIKIKKLIEKNADKIEDISYVNVLDYRETINQTLNDNKKLLKQLNAENLLEPAGGIAPILLADWAIAAAAGLAFSCFVMAVLTTKRFTASFIGLGTVLFLAGGLSAALALFGTEYIKGIKLLGRSVMTFIGELVGSAVASTFIFNGVIVLAAGAVIIILTVAASKISGKVKAKRANA